MNPPISGGAVTPATLQTYLHQHIPLSQAMQVTVVEVSLQQVVLSAPLAPNINHRETVFGGSASAVAILAAWSMLHLGLTAEGLGSRLVIQRNTMDYLAPMDGAFTAVALAPARPAWESFTRMIRRKGLGRITQAAALHYQGQVAGTLAGEFVAFGPGYA
ncbi:thioesterase domain-containing protein [Acidovorax sp. 107]|uniref:YiiD C-terminal domain-containing protein n=1 Tax=Acidovorax sp. 107 TaxID=2135638 RepID=UPI000D41BEDA|nr:YiiD C-terminal domain-containing protein [Acidovorax sp. 107]PUA97027.1 thioesterase domain-containing protein [Acidovorax sp. 107]